MTGNIYLPPSPVAPPFLLISNITNSFPMVITVTTSNNYVVGQLVHLSIPEDYGMIQADQMTGQILSIIGLNFSVNIDSTFFDPFIYPPSSTEKPATLSSGGSKNLYNFQQVPFHSVNGSVGN
jgi:hypothetical protein